MTKVTKVEETEDEFPVQVYKSYAEYAEEAKKKKFNPALMAAPEAQLPSRMRTKSPRKQKPPLDKGFMRRRVQV